MLARATDPNDLFDKFKKRAPPEFYGNEDPLDADEWIVQVEKIFEVFRFVPSLVKTEAEKVMRFIWGLNPNIKEKVTGVTLATFEENLKRAYWAEESIYNQNLQQA
ncbi:hypothetical protein AAC387_Pa01g2226 [Persea americana]